MNIDFQRTAVKTFQRLHKLPLGAVTADGWLREQLLRSKDGTGGHLDELEPDMIANPFIDYSAFKRMPNAVADADPTFAAGWSSEISGTYWTGLVQLAFTLGDAELIAKADKWVSGVLKHQEPDGYLGGYPVHTDRMADYNAWSSAWCYRALLSYYEATGRREVLDAVHRGLLWFCENWKDHKTDYVGSVIIEPMVIVYAYTGDERLIRFSRDWLNWLEEHSLWQNKVSQYLSQELPYNSMHVVAYGEDMKHPGLVYCATGEETLLRASVNAAVKALRKIVQPTGGPSSCGEYLSPKGASNETEYCNFSTFSHSYSWLAMLTGEAFWGDEIEKIVFNGAQGARMKNERGNAYMTAPNQLHANARSSAFGMSSEMGAYAPCYPTACCPAQAVRTVPEFVRGMCMRDEKGETYLFCYGPARVRTEAFSFDMETLYPFRETVTLKIVKACRHRLHLRIPGWCRAPRVQVDGADAVLTRSDDGFAALETPLNTGSTVIITLPMEIAVEKLDDRDANSKFPVCISRGPLVYALPVPEKWTAYDGNPMTPLPAGWSWYRVNADYTAEGGAGIAGVAGRFAAYKAAPWAKAVDERLSPESIRVVERSAGGYVWEDPPVTLEVPLYHAPLAYTTTGHHTYDCWQTPVDVVGEAESCTMVPHGCTNLRITLLPRANLADR